MTDAETQDLFPDLPKIPPPPPPDPLPTATRKLVEGLRAREKNSRTLSLVEKRLMGSAARTIERAFEELQELRGRVRE